MIVHPMLEISVLYTQGMLTTRRATTEDAGLITLHRKAMFADMRDAPETVLAEMARLRALGAAHDSE
jgi:hypothetical protein